MISSTIEAQSIQTPFFSLIHPLSLCSITSSIPSVLNAVVGTTYFLDTNQYPLTDPKAISSFSSLLSSRSIRVITTDGSIHSVLSGICLTIRMACLLVEMTHFERMSCSPH